jgi:hypothetical protein
MDTSKLSVFVNDDGTRTFLALLIDANSSSSSSVSSTLSHQHQHQHQHLLSTLQLSDKVFKLHGFQQYYDDPQLHVSVAWVLGNQGEKLQAIVDRYNSSSSIGNKKVLIVKSGSVVCRYGIETTTLWS